MAQRRDFPMQEREDRIQHAITRGYDDLVNGRIRPWKQAKAEGGSDASHQVRSPLPHVTIL